MPAGSNFITLISVYVADLNMSEVGNPDDFVYEEPYGGGSSREEDEALDFTPEEEETMRAKNGVEGGNKEEERVKVLKEERARSRAAEKRMEKRCMEMEKKMEEMRGMLEAEVKKRSRRSTSQDSFESRAGSTRRGKSRSRSGERGGKRGLRAKSSSSSVSPSTKTKRIEKRLERTSKEEWGRLGKGNKKQLEFIEKVEERLEDIEVRMDRHFQESGGMPKDVKKLVEKGKKTLRERSEDIWRAEKYGWKVSDRFRGDSLCKSDREERRQNRVRKEVKDEEEDSRRRRLSRARGGRGSGIMGRGPSRRYFGQISAQNLSKILDV